MKWENTGRVEVDAVLGTIHWTQQVIPKTSGKNSRPFLKKPKSGLKVLSQTLAKLA